MRACVDWPSGEGRILDNVAPFIDLECRTRLERAEALEALRSGQTYTERRGRWTLTPIPERRG